MYDVSVNFTFNIFSCIKSYKLMFKYYSRLVDIESNCDSKFNLLRAAFIEDKNLYNNKHLSWVQTLLHNVVSSTPHHERDSNSQL
jgi:hypothetical protein